MTSTADQNARTLWVLTDIFYPEEVSTGHYLTAIAEGLAASQPVKVITGQPNYSARGVRAAKSEVHNGVEIFRAWGTTLDKNVVAFRVINMLTIGMSIFLASLRRFRRGDHVLVGTNPPTLPITTTLAALVQGSTFTLLVHDSYPEVLVAVGSARPNSFFVNVVNVLNRWVYKYASNIVVMGRDMNELFVRKTAGLDVPIVTIPNWADADTIEPTPKSENPLLRELGLADKFVVMSPGNIGRPTDVRTIVEAAEKLLDREDIHFVFIGAGVKKKWLASAVADRGLTNITLLDHRPREEENVFLNACDVGLVALIKGMLGTAMPSRSYNIMAAGKPVLAVVEAGSELAAMIDEDRIGLRVEPGDADALVEAVLTLYSERDETARMGLRAREAAVAKYSLASALEAYQAAVQPR